MSFKNWSLIVCLLCAVCLLTACTTGAPEGISSGNQQKGPVWDRDANSHWLVDESGNKTDAGEHTLDEFMRCSVCGSEVWVFEDGSASIYNYNEYDEWLRITSIDADGTVLDDNSFEYGYDDNGVKLWQKQYYSGVLVEEISYIVNADSETVPHKQINYDSDGSYGEIVFDEHGNIKTQISYDFEGNLIYQEDNEYVSAESNSIYLAKQVMTWFDGSKVICEYNEFDDRVLWLEYDTEGEIAIKNTSNYEYDSDGYKRRAEHFTDDKLVTVCIYGLTSDGYNYVVRELSYFENGAYIEYTYNEKDELVSEVSYDAEGNAIVVPE